VVTITTLERVNFITNINVSAIGKRTEQLDNVSMDTNDKTKIYIVDDHPLMRAGVIRAIEEDENFVVCGEADDVEPAFAEIEKIQPDFILIDLSLKK